MIQSLAIFLIIIGMIFTGIGGFMDMTGRDKVNILSLKISKQHLFSDGTYVTVLAIALLVLSKC